MKLLKSTCEAFKKGRFQEQLVRVNRSYEKADYFIVKEIPSPNIEKWGVWEPETNKVRRNNSNIYFCWHFMMDEKSTLLQCYNALRLWEYCADAKDNNDDVQNTKYKQTATGKLSLNYNFRLDIRDLGEDEELSPEGDDDKIRNLVDRSVAYADERILFDAMDALEQKTAISATVKNLVVDWYLINSQQIEEKENMSQAEKEALFEELVSNEEVLQTSAKELREKNFMENQPIISRDDWVEKFKQWLQQHGVKSVSDYCTYLNNISNNNRNSVDVFSIRNDEQLVSFRKSLEDDEKYYAWAQQNNKQITNSHSALNKYEDFLKELIPHAHNRIIFGAPGTGKSYHLKKEVEKYFDAGNYVRVTFHPEYSFFDFVGSYKPVMAGNNILYRFVPGPFAQILRKAQQQPEKRFCLIIEEINRARVAAVFGDIFQLLDRDDQGLSEYDIIPSLELSAYLQGKNTIEEDELQPIRLPKNLYIWATMNSADQGVYPMDTAFKRRWHFEYISVDDGSPKDDVKDTWNQIRKKINLLLVQHHVNEDKQMGYYFLNQTERKNLLNSLKDKVLMYLFEDAARPIRGKIFIEKYKTYSQLKANVDIKKKNLGIFLKDLPEPESESKNQPPNNGSESDGQEETTVQA